MCIRDRGHIVIKHFAAALPGSFLHKLKDSLVGKGLKKLTVAGRRNDIIALLCSVAVFLIYLIKFSVSYACLLYTSRPLLKFFEIVSMFSSASAISCFFAGGISASQTATVIEPMVE